MRSGAACAVIALGLVLGGGGSLLSRIDRLAAEQRATSAQVRLAHARIELVRAVAQRDVTPANDPRVDVCVRRTEALRGALFALVRTGRVSMTGNPGPEWITWR